MSESMGIPAWKGVIVRMTDKFARLMNIAKSESANVQSESVADTLTDLAIYSIMARILIEEGEAHGDGHADPGKPKRARTQRRRKKNVSQPSELPPEGEATVQTS